MPALPIVDLAQRDTIRLISTGRLKESVLLPLAANHGALEEVASLESATNGRLRAQEAGLSDLDPREFSTGRSGHTFINAAIDAMTRTVALGIAHSRQIPLSRRSPTILHVNSWPSIVLRTPPTIRNCLPISSSHSKIYAPLTPMWNLVCIATPRSDILPARRSRGDCVNRRRATDLFTFL